MKSSKRRIKANRRLQNAILHRLKQQRLQLLLFGNYFTSSKEKIEDRILNVKWEMEVKIKVKGDSVVYINPTA